MTESWAIMRAVTPLTRFVSFHHSDGKTLLQVLHSALIVVRSTFLAYMNAREKQNELVFELRRVLLDCLEQML